MSLGDDAKPAREDRPGVKRSPTGKPGREVRLPFGPTGPAGHRLEIIALVYQRVR
jgi:hypothetical protein